MTGGPFWLTRPGEDALAELLERSRSDGLTYAEAGATLADAPMPEGYRHDVVETPLGVGEDVFGAACDVLRAWGVHRGAGMEVVPADAPLREGETVVVVARALGLHVTPACRIVATVDDDHRFGFAYGTLPCHPEQGEEAFVVRRRPGGQVSFEIRVFWRARHSLAAAGGPVTRWVQRRATRRYTEAMRAGIS